MLECHTNVKLQSLYFYDNLVSIIMSKLNPALFHILEPILYLVISKPPPRTLTAVSPLLGDPGYIETRRTPPRSLVVVCPSTSCCWVQFGILPNVWWDHHRSLRIWPGLDRADIHTERSAGRAYSVYTVLLESRTEHVDSTELCARNCICRKRSVPPKSGTSGKVISEDECIRGKFLLASCCGGAVLVV